MTSLGKYPQISIKQAKALGYFLTFVINPRENFDVVASIKNKSGRRIRENIRSRVEAYNNGVVPKELGFYGVTGNKEWKQYQLSEKGMPHLASCPFKASPK